MGQYYKFIILAEKTDKKEYIRTCLHSFAYANGSKLMEHSYIDSEFVKAVEYLLSSNGTFYKSRIVWAGDYADNEHELTENLFHLADDSRVYPRFDSDISFVDQCPFIVNHTKKLYVKKEKKVIHPLPLLTAEGNGRGGGDYRGKNDHLIGSWARDVISVDQKVSEDYTELVCDFDE